MFGSDAMRGLEPEAPGLDGARVSGGVVAARFLLDPVGGLVAGA
jgi:hypothetical protein